MVGIIAVLGVASSAVVLSSPASAQKGPEFIPGGNFAFSQPQLVDVIVVFTDKPSPQTIKSVGGQVHRQFTIIPAIDATIPISSIEKLQNNPNVSYVEKVMERELHEHEQTGQTFPWGVNRIDSEVPWHLTPQLTGLGVKTAVLDTGLDIGHPDISAAWGYSVIAKNPNNFDDKNGHGTHTAGTIAAKNNGEGVIGVAYDVELYSIQISKGSRLSTNNIIAGIEVAVKGPDGLNPDHPDDNGDGADVFNMSFGGGFSQAEKDALDIAYVIYGIVLVASAGNSGCDCPSYPAALENVIAVASTTTTDSRSSFSNFGSWVAIAAPGSEIYSTYKGGGYATLSGTSMAAPHVAGVAALAIQATGKTNVEIMTLLSVTSENIGIGIGLVDAEKATIGTTSGDNLAGSGGGGGEQDPLAEVGTATHADVSYKSKGGRLGVTVQLLDKSDLQNILVVPDTTVKIELSLDTTDDGVDNGSVVYVGTKTTDDEGNAKWNFVGAPKGTYSTKVLQVGGINWTGTTDDDTHTK